MSKLNSSQKILACIAAVILTAGCSGGGGADSGSGGSGIGTNIFGKISTSGGSVSGKATRGKATLDKVKGFFSVGTMSTCTVVAYNLDTNAVVATGTSDGSGYYTLSGGSLSAGSTYKIVATCGTDVLSSVASADSTAPSDKSPVVTNPRSTLIAATIIQALNTAIDAAVGVLTGTVKDAIKTAIMATLQNLAATIEKTIDDAIESGAMTEPSLASATDISNDLKVSDSTTDMSTILTSNQYTAEIPATVSGTIEGSATAASALPVCDKAMNDIAGNAGYASAAKCTGAISKLMYNVLGFPVLLLKSGGSLSTELSLGTCSSANSALVAAFNNAEFTDGNTSGIDDVPNGYCLVKSLVGSVNRNRGDQPEEDHGGPLFGETGDMGSGTVVGALTAMGTEMFNGTKYRFSDLDKLVFDNSSGAGMNNRLIARVKASNGIESFYYLSNTNAWINSPWKNTCDQNHDTVATEACQPWDVDFGFTNLNWSSATSNTGIAAAMDGGKAGILSMGIFNKKFGGAVPSMAKLDDYLDNGRIHTDYNPGGQKEFFVLYTMPTKQEAGSNPCWDNDTSTACLGVDGTTEYPALKVNITTGTPNSTTKVSKITDVVDSSTGAYYVVPVWSNGKFAGVFSFIKASTGVRMVNELRRERAVMVVTATSQCDNSNLPSVGANCVVGQLHNVTLDWSNCNGGGGNCPAINYPGTSSTPIQDGAAAVKTVNVDYDYMQMWMPTFSGSNQVGGHSLLAMYSNSGSQKLLVTINASTDAITAAGTGDANSGANQYNVAMHYNCPGGSSACTVDGFYLVKEDGTVYTRGAATSKWTTEICNPGASSCPTADVVKYTSLTTATYGLASAGYSSIDFDGDGGNGNTSFLNSYRMFRVNTGPVTNPGWKCSFEPFYIDMNGNGKLDCNTADTAAVTDVTFSGMWDYGNWVNDMSPAAISESRNTKTLMKNDNAYSFKDPVGTKKLLTTAFSGWFDGTRSLSTTTDLNAIQNFALIFLFFEEGDGQKSIGSMSGLPTGATGQFEVTGPTQGGGSDSALNDAIGKGFQNFHQ